MKTLIKQTPTVSSLARKLFRKRISPPELDAGSTNYWIDRYESGLNSGRGSFGKLAEFKAEILNEFVLKNDLKTVIEFGCGDGNQLKLAAYQSYLGFDVSHTALSLCEETFMNDPTKSFKLMEEYQNETSELTLSLDVLYHLIEDSTFTDYMNTLFDSAERFVIIYSSDTDANPKGTAAHIKHRNFSRWVESNKPEWRLRTQIPNKYPFQGNSKTGSFADFFIYEKA